jgi:endonuclease/exonuclease/phosphatase (EEP) superfamily protein YafD
VLSINALGFRDLSSAIIAQIERLDPDIIAIQEVNPGLANTLESHFASRYSCMILKPAHGSWGMGTLAKNPCSEIQLKPEGSWVGPPIIIETTTSLGTPVTLANIHAIHPHAGVLDAYPAIERRTDLSVWKKLSQPIHDREASIRFLLDTIGDSTGRNIIISGDLNASMRNGVYRTIRSRGYKDTWLDQRSVLTGGTWPAPQFLGSIGLGWLLRIDFIFRSEALLPIDVELLPGSIGSDHRGLFAQFAIS